MGKDALRRWRERVAGEKERRFERVIDRTMREIERERSGRKLHLVRRPSAGERKYKGGGIPPIAREQHAGLSRVVRQLAHIHIIASYQKRGA